MDAERTSKAAGRRSFLRYSAISALTFWIGGIETLLSPAQAREQGAALRCLSAHEAITLEALGETLHPGAAQAGISQFVDQQLDQPAERALLIAKHFLAPPYLEFYQEGLAALDHYSERRFSGNFAALSNLKQSLVVDALSKGDVSDWPPDLSPAQLFYLVVRGDAVDVVYATAEGFAQAGLPYMAHITPPQPW